MKLTEAQVREYKQLYEEKLGEEISMDEAREMAARLINLYLKLAERLPGDLTDEPPRKARSGGGRMGSG